MSKISTASLAAPMPLPALHFPPAIFLSSSAPDGGEWEMIDVTPPGLEREHVGSPSGESSRPMRRRRRPHEDPEVA